MASSCSPCWTPDSTASGELPPWEVAKAYAFSIVLQTAAEVTGTPASELVGGRVDEFIAAQVSVKEAFAAPGGRGLEGLAKDLRSRCTELIRRKGERLPK